MSRLMDEFRAKAVKEVVEKIVKENSMESAAKMLKDDIPIEKIVKWSGLSFDEVIAFQSELNKT